jgi:putative membrane protein
MMGSGGGMMGSGMMAGGMMTPRAGGMMGPDLAGGAAPSGAGGWAWGLGMALGSLATLAFWGALIAGAVLVVRSLGGAAGRGGGTAAETPLAILRRRYAAGEIDRATYERIRAELDGGSESRPPAPLGADRNAG